MSGVNFAVAETGTLLLVENEGNGRMSTTVPPVHIAVTGIEKVVENLRDVVPLVSLLTRSALGQPITTYVNMISGPRKPGELDGPEEVHLVLLDNGRSQAFADSELRQPLSGALRQYGRLLKDREFLGHALTGGIAMAGMFAYIDRKSVV